MHYKPTPTLTSIPERIEYDEEAVKWVSKKKHEVLKAKYKCLKKLFQIYDASVIGILPETYSHEPQTPKDIEETKHRRKKSIHTETEVSASTDIDVGDTETSAANAVIRDLKLDKIPSETKSKITITKDDKSTQDSKENLLIDSEKEIVIQPHPVPYLVINENVKRRPTRFQCFIQRILGIRRESSSYVLSHDRQYAASDNNVSNRYEKRRRRGLRLRSSRRTKKTHSEIELRDEKSPVILSYVQSIQRNCLMDTTPRYCPMVGCKMLLYGIINYNDHLNLCHFADRTYVCVYCHEGFTREHDKAVHEQEHIGITKLVAPPSTARFSTKIASDTQTDPEISKIDVPEDKLQKIVSFFDRISDPEQMIEEFNKNPTNLQLLHRNPRSNTVSLSGSEKSSSDRNAGSLPKTRSKVTSTVNSDLTSNYLCVPPVRCQLCGENFDYRGQLNLHLDQHHRNHNKFTKYKSCAGILNRSNHDSSLNVQPPTQSLTRSIATTDVSNMSNLTKVSRRKSHETLSYEPSTNIVYYTSEESVKKPSFVQKVRSGFLYKWEPGTKIIRV
ncbi:jg22478 [Pararge aegeria aegeria]|uniref:Jg22478 protein n=1 Tax=Pararge aegeria aegeria TaxID=348720 RepID=A0A8S4SI94_9NEOP|nr:jg22478 [Pararge aegeria aegeria]